MSTFTWTRGPLPPAGFLGVASLRLALARAHRRAGDVAEHDRQTAERGEAVTAGDSHLQAAVERVAHAELVDRAGVDRGDTRAVRLLPREPERLDVRIPI